MPPPPGPYRRPAIAEGIGDEPLARQLRVAPVAYTHDKGYKGVYMCRYIGTRMTWFSIHSVCQIADPKCIADLPSPKGLAMNRSRVSSGLRQ
jgi:hypothetical protein